MRSLVEAIDRLHAAGYLHCDLSYFNLLYQDGLPLLADMQTLTSVDEVRPLCCAPALVDRGAVRACRGNKVGGPSALCLWL